MFSFLHSRRVAVTSILLVVSAVMAYSAFSLRIDPGAEALMPAGGKDPELLREFTARFGSDEILVLALHADPLFTAENLALMDGLSRKLARLPHVRSVLSPTNARDIDGDELGPFSTVPYEEVVSGRLSPEDLGHLLTVHPIYSSLLVSQDARTAGLLVEIDRIERDDEYRRTLVGQARDLASEAARSGGDRGLTAYVAGIPVEKVDVAAFIERDQMVLAPVIITMMGIALTLLYRHAVGAFVPLIVMVLSLIWTLGLYGMAGRALNPVTALITPVVLVVSVAGSVHLVNHHLFARAGGLHRLDALKQAVDRSRGPCFNAALTTAIGFGSLVLLPIPAIRDFGLFTAGGVLISYVLTMLAGPLLVGWLPDIPARTETSFRVGAIERVMKRQTAWVLSHPVLAGAGSACVLGLSLAGVARIGIETDVIRSLKPSSALYQATAFIDGHLTGVNSLEIMVRGVGPRDPVGLARVARFEEEVRTLDGVRHVAGLPDLYARVNRAFHEGDDRFAVLPGGTEAGQDIADARDLLEREAGAELSRYLWEPRRESEDQPILRVAARVEAIDTASSQALFGKVREAATRAGLDAVDLTGSFAVLSDMSTTLVSNQIRGLVPALLLILAAISVQFRSIPVGLVSAIPNGAPILMVYGLMGWSGIALSVPTAMIASIGIGMTVDSTIHLMARFRDEFRIKGDYGESLAAMLDASGRAVVFSTMTVALGFLAGVLGSFQPTVHFGLLTGAALLLGLACETVLLPLVLIAFRPFGRGSRALPVGLAVVCALTLISAPRAGEDPPLLLKDQYGRADGPGMHRGRPILLLTSLPADLRKMKSWEQKVIEEGEKDVQVLRVANALALQGKKTEAEVSERLRKAVPETISILIDWNGDVTRAYSLPGDEIAATVIAPDGMPCHTETGAVGPDAAGRLRAALSRVREKGACP